MAKSRRQDTRSEKNERDLIQKLKAMIRGKDKEIARLRKELGKRAELTEAYQEIIDAEVSREIEQKKSEKKNCPKCGSDTEEAPLGKFVLETCTGTRCSWRKRRSA